MHDERPLPPAARPIDVGELADVLQGSVRGGRVQICDIVDHDGAPELDAPGVLFASRPSRRPGADDELKSRAARERAVQRGAVAVLAEEGSPTDDLGVPVISVPDVNAALGPAAAAVHRYPSRSLPIVLVTGTDGKTTTTFMTRAALEAATGRTVGMLSTIHRLVGGQVEPSRLTTPEAAELQRQLRRMVEAGDRAAVMEASSIALAQDRLRGVEGAVGVFTNLTPEHLDVHSDMEAYFAAKELLFIDGYVSTGVINVDTEAGRRMAESARRARIRVVTVSPSGDVGSADLHTVRRMGPTRAEASVHGQVVEVVTGLPGAHNLANAMGALAAAIEIGEDRDAALRGIAELSCVPGRLERIDDPRESIAAFVDYAHTPAALDVAVRTGREIAMASGGRLCVIAGCGGDRDPHKRSPMGRIVARGADLPIFTTDNPRTEDPRQIIEAMLADVPAARRDQVLVELDREAAIAAAVRELGPGDVLIVAGKGHEAEQIGPHGSRPFDDRDVLARALASQDRLAAPVACAPQQASAPR